MKIKIRIQRVVPYLLIMLIAGLMLWPQIYSHAFVSGYDYYFHMSRTYETAMQIKTDHFSYFLSLFSWNHNARIVNALYGPFGGYVSGLILLLTKSWFYWEISMSWLVLVLAGGMMYTLGRYWKLNRYVNFLISVLYMLSEPVSDYVFNQMFAGFGAALLPLLVLLVSEILTEKDVSPVKFALILTLIVEIHLMTFILSMVFVIPCLLISLIVAKKSRQKLFKHLCKGTILMLVLSFNVWGAILEVFGSNLHHIIPTFPGTHLGDRSYSAILNTYPRTSLFQSPSLIGAGVAFLILSTLILWIIDVKHLNYVVTLFVLLGTLFIWISSGYFPWTFVKDHAYVAASLIQFPKRFLPLGLILIYLTFGLILSKQLQNNKLQGNNSRKLINSLMVIMLLCLVGWGWYHNHGTHMTYIHTYQSNQVINWHHFTVMNWQTKQIPNQLRNSLRNDQPREFLALVDSPVPDYLPTNVAYRHTGQYKLLNPQARYQRNYGKKSYFRWTVLGHGRELITLPSKQGKFTTVPFVKYAHTQVWLNHRLVSPQINKVGAIRLRLRTGHNYLLLQYRPSLWFKAGMLVSIIVWLMVLLSISKIRVQK